MEKSGTKLGYDKESVSIESFEFKLLSVFVELTKWVIRPTSGKHVSGSDFQQGGLKAQNLNKLQFENFGERKILKRGVE